MATNSLDRKTLHRDAPMKLLTKSSPGVTVLTIALPILTYTFAFLCNDLTGCPAPSLLSPSTFSLAKLKRETGWTGLSGLFSVEATGWTLGYYLLSLTLYSFLPADEPMGTELRTGGRLKYRFNGMPLREIMIARANTC